MARRAGKAANRRARQRTIKRPAPPGAAATSAPRVDSADAREAASIDAPRHVVPPAAVSAGSTLSLRARAEYHYVERDLRNIGILVVVMAALLLLAWAVFNATGLVG